MKERMEYVSDLHRAGVAEEALLSKLYCRFMSDVTAEEGAWMARHVLECTTSNYPPSLAQLILQILPITLELFSQNLHNKKQIDVRILEIPILSSNLLLTTNKTRKVSSLAADLPLHTYL